MINPFVEPTKSPEHQIAINCWTLTPEDMAIYYPDADHALVDVYSEWMDEYYRWDMANVAGSQDESIKENTCD